METKKTKHVLDSFKTRLNLVIKNGRFSIGYKTTIKLLKKGKCKLVIIANNCLSYRRLELEYYAMLNKCPVNHFFGDNIHLGNICGKPFGSCCFGILDSGNVDVSTFFE
ncbi:60S ribosomal protein L30 (nucleomorph) [Cryptomonas paramecium]|uniref:60S ribosomal protein L30 n=1 Tax=Cryptomonas paramaecium TaxID=2898 RepID=F2HHK3_9CRYP|nr:60S ribosomal protein L30 [Cryptomonas paramecium]AEA38799.1 60S ribosomal protein L30 [Cryptomonas paramecium]|mmetsp:Transcript_58689/g.155194  ORF Transcript_58689/g.155194 Transcript_58689/m.155194 type:complete len:109 (-) Transcript_58689:1970-2296(-)